MLTSALSSFVQNSILVAQILLLGGGKARKARGVPPTTRATRSSSKSKKVD